MSKSSYRTAPLPLRSMPPGIPYIIANEAAERFSYYGMRGILVVFMTRYLLDQSGQPAPMSEAEARAWYHSFSTAAYLFPLAGAVLADFFLGKYRTILSLSIVYCLGHLALALDETRLGLSLGLTLIAIGAGGIKPCVSAHVGDQFGESNQHLISKVFAWFYFSINFGAFISSLLTPILLERYGPSLAFGLPGALMLFATIVFWSGRRTFAHIPAGDHELYEQLRAPDTWKLLASLAAIYVFIVPFWSLFDQTGSAWVLQARHMDLTVAGYTFLPSQIQAANPILVLLFIPLFSYGLYPLLARYLFDPKPLRRIALGLALAALPFLLLGWVEGRIVAGERPTILWQLLAYALITAAEILVSITALEFAYTQAKGRLKSLVMVYYLLSISLGNFFTAGVNFFIQSEEQSVLSGAAYYYFFAAVMGLSALLFLPVMMLYKERRYIQKETGDRPAG